MLKRALVLALLLFLVTYGALAMPAQAQSPESGAPYLYYFDNELLAFVIECADGTDSHILGDGLVTLTNGAQNTSVDGPGWSPSGELFAWTAEIAMAGRSGGHRHKPYLVSADGSQRLRLLDGLEDMRRWCGHQTPIWS